MTQDNDRKPDQQGRFEGLSDLMKRGLTLGGLLTKEDARNLLREMLPKNLTEYVTLQLDTLRSEVSATVRSEVASMIRSIDTGAIVKALEGRKIKITAEIEIKPLAEKPAGDKPRRS